MGLSKANQTSFKKGHIPWTKGRKMNDATREKQSRARKAYYKRIGGYPEELRKWQSKFAKENNFGGWNKGRVDELANNWKGDGAGYHAIHKWLVKKFGKASKCENLNCTYPKRTKNRSILRLPKGFHWALLHGKKYVHKRENFIMLCNSCHRKYDMNIEVPLLDFPDLVAHNEEVPV